jgi:hypothetical protein
VDFNSLLEAASQHRWVLVGAIVVGAIVATVKQGWAGTKLQAQLPPRWIPFLAPLYAALTVGPTEIVAGKSWQVSASDSVAALVSGLLAVLGHEIVVEALRGGKELIPNKAELAAARLKGSL